MRKLKSSVVKLMINSFSNGNIELVKEFYNKYGVDVFNYTPNLKRGNYNRLIIYAIKHGHFDIVQYYLEIVGLMSISSREIDIISRHVSSKNRINNWYNNYILHSSNKKILDFIEIDKFLRTICLYTVQTYDLSSINNFIDLFPHYRNCMLESCSSSARGLQIRRHLLLTIIMD